MQSRKVGTIDFYCTYLEVILYLLVEYIWPWYTFDIVLGKMLHLFSFFLSFVSFFFSLFLLLLIIITIIILFYFLKCILLAQKYRSYEEKCVLEQSFSR